MPSVWYGKDNVYSHKKIHISYIWKTVVRQRSECLVLLSLCVHFLLENTRDDKMGHDHVVLDDKTSDFYHDFSVPQPLQTDQLYTHRGASSLRHSAERASSHVDCAPCPDVVNVDSHRATPTTTTALIWSPARDVEHEQRSCSGNGKHATNSSSHKR